MPKGMLLTLLPMGMLPTGKLPIGKLDSCVKPARTVGILMRIGIDPHRQ